MSPQDKLAIPRRSPETEPLNETSRVCSFQALLGKRGEGGQGRRAKATTATELESAERQDSQPFPLYSTAHFTGKKRKLRLRDPND